MIDFKEFKNLILIPALQSVDLFSDNAVALLLDTMAQESGFATYVAQEGGPAKGVFEMEGNTYNNIINHLSSQPILRNKILLACNFKDIPSVSETIWNLRYASIIARVFYLLCPGDLPDANDIEGQWEYYKKYWNSNLGKATREEFMANHQRYIKD